MPASFPKGLRSGTKPEGLCPKPASLRAVKGAQEHLRPTRQGTPRNSEPGQQEVGKGGPVVFMSTG